MATGKPAIPSPRGLDPTVIRQAIDNIRERLAACDSEINALRALAEASSSGQNISVLQRQIAQLTSQLSALSAQVGAVTSADEEEPADNSQAVLAELIKATADQSPSDSLRAEFAELEKRVNSLEQGVLA